VVTWEKVPRDRVPTSFRISQVWPSRRPKGGKDGSDSLALCHIYAVRRNLEATKGESIASLAYPEVGLRKSRSEYCTTFVVASCQSST